MPGMMDTILNLGLNDEVAEGLGKATNNERFAYDSYRRFIQMFAKWLWKLINLSLMKFLTRYKEQNGITLDTDLTAENLKEIVKKYKEYL